MNGQDREGGGRHSASVRTRLTALTVAVVVAPLLLAVALTVTMLHRSLTASLRDRAEARSAHVADLLTSEGVAGLQGDQEVLSDPGRAVQVIDPAGAVVFATTRAAAERPLSVLRPSAGVVTVTGDQPLPAPGPPPELVVARGVAAGGSRYTVFVVASQLDQHEAVGQAGKTMLLGLPALLVGVGAATWLLVGRTLSPVDHIRRAAADITANRLDTRVPVPGSNDEIGRLAVTMNDMLDRLEGSQRAQRRFIADASHELRSPLTSLRAAIQYGADADAGTWAELVPLMDRESGRLQGLIDDLLTLSKADDAGTIALRLAAVDLDDVISMEQRRLRVSDQVTVTGTVTPVQVVGDEGQLVRLVRNLCDNAARAANSTVSLSLTRSAADDAVIAVEDDGGGIAPEDRERVFDRFVRLDDDRSRRGGGSGLGLAIVAEIVRAHHGAIAIDDSPLGGARFSVRLPADPRQVTSEPIGARH